MNENHNPQERPFYHLGRIIAVLELGARGHGEIRWLHRYYPTGFLGQVGLREPLQKHRQSVRPRLERQGRAETYRNTLNRLADALQETGEAPEPRRTFESWAGIVLSNKQETKDPGLPTASTPEDAPLYAQGYMVERQTLQPKRPPLPGDEDIFQFCWDYHQGRLLTWNIAGNDPGLPLGIQLAIKDRRAVTTADPAGRPSGKSHSSR